MRTTVISNESFKNELLIQSKSDLADINWQTSVPVLNNSECLIDLLFDESDERIRLLSELKFDYLILNSVISTTNRLPENSTRINGWPSFLNRPLVEVATSTENLKPKIEEIFSRFSKKVEWVPDIPGFISPRVISMIINEAYYTLEDGVAGKEEIDTAMKLGTRYPYGPFEWCKKIGVRNIFNLLEKLSAENSRYTPSALLKKEAFS